MQKYMVEIHEEHGDGRIRIHKIPIESVSVYEAEKKAFNEFKGEAFYIAEVKKIV